MATLRPNGGGGVNVFNVHADHLNTPRLVTDAGSNIRWQWESDPFGTTSPDENPAALGTFEYNLRFPGQQYDAVVGLHYNYYRDLDSATGRYVESDPIGLRGGINTYGYALNSPTSLADPLGQDVTVCYYSSVTGHVGIGVNGNQTEGRYPSPRAISMAFCFTGGGVIQRDDPAHDWVQNARKQCLTIKTTPSQDQAVQNFINAAKDTPNQNYNLCNNQCTSFVITALGQAGLVPPGAEDAIVPSTLFERLQQMYSHPQRTGHW